ncbi:MAG: glycoside hydrolase family 97 catalytic domain-containing protein [Bacteroidales bacterium]
MAVGQAVVGQASVGQASVGHKAEGHAAGERQLYYRVTYRGEEVVRESELGVLIENALFESALGIENDSLELWGANLNVTGVERRDVDTTWTPVYGERSRVRDHYREMTVSFLKGELPEGGPAEGYDRKKYYFMDLQVRAYNEGIAFRYHFPEADNGLFLHIVGEQTSFRVPEGSMAYFERWAQGPYELRALKDWTDSSERPLTLRLANGWLMSLLEAKMVDYARTKFALHPEVSDCLQAEMYGSVDVMTPYDTPWRVIMVGERDVDLMANNDLVLNLNTENQIQKTDWIKPGKVFRSGLTQADALRAIDFAAERNMQYVHLDAGWYGPEMHMASKATRVHERRDLDFPALTRYAATKGIGIFVYVNQRALYHQLDEILPLYKEWGIKGIKFGFVQIGNQKWSTWLHEAVRKCAAYEMLVDIHDEYRPTGFSRTYPNLMTQEGIRGNEEFPDATHNTILPFTRFLAGAGDYTICYFDKRLQNTHAHQLALAVVYYSPLQFVYWYDKPEAYDGEPEIAFFDRVKTVWDETLPLDGRIGEYVTVARRSGSEWFVGALTNNEAREVEIPLTFLETGKRYSAFIYTDDAAVKTKTQVRVETKRVTSKTVLRLKLKARGGAAIRIESRD